jgi:hypothetical protein
MHRMDRAPLLPILVARICSYRLNSLHICNLLVSSECNCIVVVRMHTKYPHTSFQDRWKRYDAVTNGRPKQNKKYKRSPTDDRPSSVLQVGLHTKKIISSDEVTNVNRCGSEPMFIPST